MYFSYKKYCISIYYPSEKVYHSWFLFVFEQSYCVILIEIVFLLLLPASKNILIPFRIKILQIFTFIYKSFLRLSMIDEWTAEYINIILQPRTTCCVNMYFNKFQNTINYSIGHVRENIVEEKSWFFLNNCWCSLENTHPTKAVFFKYHQEALGIF
jgi:hypothetical protein